MVSDFAEYKCLASNSAGQSEDNFQRRVNVICKFLCNSNMPNGIAVNLRMIKPSKKQKGRGMLKNLGKKYLERQSLLVRAIELNFTIM